MENQDMGIDKEFIDENGEKATLHIESSNGYGLNMSNRGRYKLANFGKNKVDTNGVVKKNIFLRDIGVKSSGFTRVAGLSMILVIGCLIIMYLLFRFQVIRVKNYILDYVNENEYKKKEKAVKKYNMLAYKKLIFEYYNQQLNTHYFH